MKPIALFLILVLTPFTTMININDFSINLFIKRLKDKGLFEVILQIKYAYGQDVAIISCEELNKNNCGNCKKVVIEYMPKKKKNENPNQKHKGSIFSKPKGINNIMKPSRKVVIEQIISEMKDKIKNILKKKLSPKNSELFANNIVAKFAISKF